jgi:hypothetical protein
MLPKTIGVGNCENHNNIINFSAIDSHLPGFLVN